MKAPMIASGSRVAEGEADRTAELVRRARAGDQRAFRDLMDAYRNAFYGLRLSQLLALPRTAKPLAAHWVIDETAAVSLAQKDRASARLGFTVTGLTLYLLWNLTTLLGALGAEAIGDTAAWGLDAAGPAVFLALLAPMLRTATERAVAALALVLGLGFLPVLPAGVPVLVAALAAPAVLFLKGRRP